MLQVVTGLDISGNLRAATDYVFQVEIQCLMTVCNTSNTQVP